MSKIAIIGISCLLPGASSAEVYWQNLLDGKNSKSTAGRKQMGVDPSAYFAPEKGVADRFYCMEGGYIDDFTFDPTGYDLPAGKLTGLDDLHQWSLHVAREALRDSGYLGDAGRLAKCGVILGNLSFPTKSSNHLFLPIYHAAVESSLKELLGDASFSLPPFDAPAHSSDGPSDRNAMISGYPSALIAQALSLSGAAFSMDAACASSIYSVRLACDYLASGKSDMMLAGAVSAADPFFTNMGFSIFQAYPTVPHSSPLDRGSRGLIAGEGAGFFVLKRYEDAVRDKDKIYGAVLGAGLSNDGRGQSVLSPSSDGQNLAFERAYDQAGINPREIAYVECHATGTPLGDKVELDSMDTFFGKYGASPLVGSSKSNLGHLLTAAGMSGMIKTILAMARGVIPPTIGLTDAHSSKNNVISKAQIPATRTPWPTDGESRFAAVSGFGFGGTNGHIVLEYRKEQEEKAGESSGSDASCAGEPAEVINLFGKAKEKDSRSCPMVITGMDALFGSSENLSEFHRTNYDGLQHFIPLPEKRWKGLEKQGQILEEYGFEGGRPPKGAYIEKFDLDFLRFRIPPNKDDRLIPQQLITLRVADNAIREARLQEGSRVAVLVAMGAEPSLHQFRGRVNLTTQLAQGLPGLSEMAEKDAADFEGRIKESVHGVAKVNQYTSFIGNIMASRIASVWDFSGPAFSISSEENSVNRCLEVARLLLDNREAEAVVVAAVDLSGSFENVLIRNRQSRVNKGTATLAFDEGSNGWMIGEGAGAVVLRRRDDALEKEDRIYACIDAVEFSRGVDSASVATACRKALDTAGVAPADVNYVEVHASGIAGEDDAEIEGLVEAYGESAQRSAGGSERDSGKKLKCAIGSVKANIGHTFAASGMAGLIRTALCLYNRFIPRTPGWSGPKYPEKWEESPFFVPTDSGTWFADGRGNKRVAAISGMGADGCASHLILSDEPGQTGRKNDYLTRVSPSLFIITGDGMEELTAGLNRLAYMLDSELALPAVAGEFYTLFSDDDTGRYRIALVGQSRDEVYDEISLAKAGIGQALSDNTEWSTQRGSYFTPEPLGRKGKIAFVYPGGFNSYIGLGRNLFQLFPEVYEQAGEYTANPGELLGSETLYPRSMTSLSEAEIKSLSEKLFNTPSVMFESGIMSAILYTDIIRESFGISPDQALGYSMGEVSMLFALGVWDRSDRISKSLRESPVFQTRITGSMDNVRKAWNLEGAGQKKIWYSYKLEAGPDAVRAALERDMGHAMGRSAYLIFVNTPGEVVIAGDDQACKRVIRDLGCNYFEVPVTDAIHSELVRPDYENLINMHRLPVNEVANIDFYSAFDFAPIVVDSEVIAKNVANIYSSEIDFQKLIEKTYDDGGRIFIELGPRDNCAKWVGEILGERKHLAVSINRKGDDENVTIIQALARLFCNKVTADLSPLFVSSKMKSVSKRLLVKSITLGGDSISSQILSEENRKIAGDLLRPPSEAKSVAGTDKRLEVKPAAVTDKHPEANPVERDTKTEKISKKEGKEPTMAPEPRQIDDSSADHDLSGASCAAFPGVTEGELQGGNVTPAPIFPSEEIFKQNISLINTAHEEFLKIRNQGAGQIKELIELQIALASGSAIVAAEEGAGGHYVRYESVDTAPAASHSVGDPAPVGDQGRAASATQNPQHAEALPGSVTGAEVIEMPHKPDLMEREEIGQALPLTPIEVKTSRPNIVASEVVTPEVVAATKEKAPGVIWDQEDLLEFAEGSIARVFGEEYAIIDSYPRRVRLPLMPYLLVTRVTELTGTNGEFKPSTMTTEYDIPLDSWYGIDGQIPWAVSVESGQCDLLLISYLGIDFSAKGERVYRLLDCTLTFLTDIAMEGETLRYEISINSFARNGESLLFFFSYECFVEDKMVLKMDGGCAGFFTDAELAEGKGIIRTEEEIREREAMPKKSFTPFLTCDRTSFEREDLLKIIAGNRGGCFGPDYALEGLNPSLRFASEEMLMIDRVAEIDVTGGPWGLGTVVAQKILAPEHWYFPCHFKDDQVMAGSLMAEGCGQLLQFFLLYMGMHTKTVDARFQPIANLPQKVRCRGQVTPQNGVLTYRMEIVEIGLTPCPHAVANIDILLDDRIVVDFKNLGVQLVEKRADDPHRIESKGTPLPAPVDSRPVPEDDALFTLYHLRHFATGSIAECFGPDFAIYEGRQPPRTPNGDLQLTTRVIEVSGKRMDFSKPAYAVAEYEVPGDAWYFANNSHPGVMPYSVIMEIALQPCGFISACMGTTLISPETDFYFRNLDGAGTLHRDMDVRGKTIRNKSTLLSTASMGNTIIQTFEFAMDVDGEPYYSGTAAFGYFVAAALTDQVGIDGGVDNHPLTERKYLTGVEISSIDLKSIEAAERYYTPAGEKPFWRLSGPQLDFLNTVQIVSGGGKNELGYIYAERKIDPADWFFKCHFFQDPVMPGSLGVESVMQALQVFALDQGLDKEFSSPRFTQIEDTIVWKYRGQINPDIDAMSIEVHITRIDKGEGQVIVVGDASLWKDRIRIYEVRDIALRIEEA